MHSRLEDYLDEVATRLGPLPRKRRDEELREMRAHLGMAYAAGLERGRSEDEAARDVLTQFGTPDVVGAETVAAWRRGRRMDRLSFWGAAACGFGLSVLLPSLLMVVGLAAWSGPGPMPNWVLATSLACYFLAPAIKGGVVGLLFPRRAVAGTGLVVALCWVMEAICRGFGFSLSILLQLSIFNGLISLLSAWAVSRWRTARAGRARAARV